MNPHIFREYDIRGLVVEDLTSDTVWRVGRAYGSMIGEGGGSRVAVGFDVRESSPALAHDLIRGITAAGIDVMMLGMVPTPTLYFAVHQHGLDGGVQVTGSHNPLEYNGLKMMRGRGSLWGEALQELRRRAEIEETTPEAGGSVQDHDVREEYLSAMATRLRLERPLRLVIDAGNGCAGEPAPELFRRLGCEVECLYCDPDGRFPNHIPDPTLPETLKTLRERVLASGADMGLAYDGDADRLGALDEQGRILWGDQLLALFSRELLAKQPGSSILFEVKASRALIEDIEAHGGKPIMTRTGHSVIKEKMKETGAPLAGEMSGHLFFADDWFGFDDAIYASGRLVQLIAATGRSLGSLADDLPHYYATPEIRVDCADEKKFSVVDAIRQKYRSTHTVVEVDGARIEFDRGWGLVRASNTQPVLVVRAEGVTAEARDEILSELGASLALEGVEGPLPG